jgi:uncharacterized protein
MISRRQFLTLGASTAGFVALGAADALALEPGLGLAVKEWKVAHPDWPSSARPLRIGVIADIHAVEPWMPAKRVGAIAARMNSLAPDLIVLLGDYVNALRLPFHSALVPVPEWTAALKDLHAPLGVYAVLGNHDCLYGQEHAIRHNFEKAGIHLLENSAIKVGTDRNRFWLAGLGDQIAGMDDLHGTLRQIRDTSPAILLSHEPYIFKRVPDRVALTLAGHTHGGQVYVPFVGRPAVPLEYARYAYGHIKERGRQMIVSSGLGLSGYPVRFLVPPEIAIVTLQGVNA